MRCRWCHSLIPVLPYAHRNGVCIPCMKKQKQKEEKMKETDFKLLCVLVMNQIYNDIRMIVREELERVKE